MTLIFRTYSNGAVVAGSQVVEIEVNGSSEAAFVISQQKALGLELEATL